MGYKFLISYNCKLFVLDRNTWYMTVCIHCVDIYRCLSIDGIWHSLFIVRSLMTGEVEHKLRLVLYKTMLVIGLLSAVWVRWSCWDLGSLSTMWVRHICLLIAWTSPEGLGLCFAVNDCSPTRRTYTALNLSLTLMPHPLRMSDGPVKKPGKCITCVVSI